MLKKQLNEFGQKAYQRTDREDRSLVYKDWLRTVKTPKGFFMDIDMIKWGTVDGKIVPKAITELTRCDHEEINERYLRAIIDRWFFRDKQAAVVTALAEQLHVPAYLVCFQKDMKWLWVFSFQKKEWKHFTTEDWATYLSEL